MEDSGEHSGSSSPRTPRVGRLWSRTILPALRNLVRSNRPQRSRVAPEAEQSSPSLTSTNITSTTTQSNLPLPETIPDTIENINSDSSTDPPLICTNVQEPSEQQNPEPSSPPPLLPSPSPLEPLASLNNETGLQLLNNIEALANLNNLRGEENQTEEIDPNSPNGRQRYRLVVYFEERSQQEQQPAARYVAVIVGRLDELQFLVSKHIPISKYYFPPVEFIP